MPFDSALIFLFFALMVLRVVSMFLDIDLILKMKKMEVYLHCISFVYQMSNRFSVVGLPLCMGPN